MEFPVTHQFYKSSWEIAMKTKLSVGQSPWLAVQSQQPLDWQQHDEGMSPCENAGTNSDTAD